MFYFAIAVYFFYVLYATHVVFNVVLHWFNVTNTIFEAEQKHNTKYLKIKTHTINID